MKILILGSGPNATEAADWPKAWFDLIVVINNAFAVRPDWDICIHPEDFPPERRPQPGPGQRLVGADEYVEIQNRFGGFVYAGGTMAFTAGYWALGALRPSLIAYLGCDMTYAATGPTHFYGTGEADPLRKDISLRSLEAKGARLMATAAAEGCAMANLSGAEASRLVFPRATPSADMSVTLPNTSADAAARAKAEEDRLGYVVASGRYWEEEDRFDPAAIDALDQLWLRTLPSPAPAQAQRN